MIGWSELIFGSMYCGKSDELIRRLKRVEIAGKKYQLFKPSIDTRYGVSTVATHENNSKKKKIEKIIKDHTDHPINEALIPEITKEISGSMEAFVVNNSKEILNYVQEDIKVIGIDEVQFFDMELILVVDELIKMGKRVILAGLDMYASGEPWGVVPFLACKAKYVEKLHAVCVDCGSDAYISYKVDNIKDNVESHIDVGSVNKYIALCEKCADRRNKKSN